MNIMIIITVSILAITNLVEQAKASHHLANAVTGVTVDVQTHVKVSTAEESRNNSAIVNEHPDSLRTNVPLCELEGDESGLLRTIRVDQKEYRARQGNNISTLIGLVSNKKCKMNPRSFCRVETRDSVYNFPNCSPSQVQWVYININSLHAMIGTNPRQCYNHDGTTEQKGDRNVMQEAQQALSDLIRMGVCR